MTWARNMQNSLSRLFAVVGLVVVCATPAAAQLEIEITRGMSSRTPVAIVPFGWEGLESVDIDAPFERILHIPCPSQT